MLGLPKPFRKKQVTFHSEDEFFTIDDEVYRFADITAYFMTSTDLYTNGVFEGNRLNVSLRIGGGEDLHRHEVDSQYLKPYHLLQQISAAIESYRAEKLLQCYTEQSYLSLPIKGESTTLYFRDDILCLNDEQVQSCRLNIETTAISFEFAQPDKTISIAKSDVSDTALFLYLVASLKLLVVEEIPETSSKFLRYLFVALGIFALNGWFDIYTANTTIANLSDVSGFVFFIVLVLVFTGWLAANVSERFKARLQRKLDALNK